MDYAKESLKLHEQWKGKIEVVATVPVKTKEDLSLAYTPGVAQPCLEIQKDVNKSYELTRRHNLCLVVTDGTAVLGLGDIGPEAGMLPALAGRDGKRFGEDAQAGLDDANDALSAAIREHPEQWMWMYPRWESVERGFFGDVLRH